MPDLTLHTLTASLLPAVLLLGTAWDDAARNGAGCSTLSQHCSTLPPHVVVLLPSPTCSTLHHGCQLAPASLCCRELSQPVAINLQNLPASWVGLP